MKLLSKTQVYFMSLLLVLLIIWSVIFLYVISSVIQSNIDETLQSEMKASISRLKAQQLSYFTSYGKENPRIDIAPIDSIRNSHLAFADTTFYNSVEKERIPYRQLSVELKLGGQPVKLTMRKSTVEYDDLFYAILLTEFLFVIILIIALYWMNRRLLQRLWEPFFATLDEASRYRLAEKKGLRLPETNIEEFHQLNDVLQDMIAKMQQDYQSLKQFTENASHEIQTPLSVIANKTEMLLQDDALSEGQTQNLARIHETAGKLSRLNRALLMLTKIENEQYSSEQNMNFSQLLVELIPDYETLAQSKDITIKKEVEADVQVKINAELAELLLRNLLSNAIKHNVDGGYVKLTLGSDGFTIQNTGCEAAQQPDELFERFIKGEPDADSLGLGLSIVSAIAESSNMDISYRCEKSLHIICLKFRSS